MDRPAISLYRLAVRWPPDDDDYKSFFEQGRTLRPPVTAEKRDAWTGLSAYDSEFRARQIAEQFPRRWRGASIVRYDLPANVGFRWEQTFAEGHYTIWATRQQLEPYLAFDFRRSV